MKTGHHLPWLKIALFSFIIVAASQNVSGQETEAAISDSLRAAELRVSLRHETARFNRWWYGWLAGYSAATVAQGTIAVTTDDIGLRQDMVLGAATTLLGAAGQILSPSLPYGSPLRSYEKEDIYADEMVTEEMMAALALRETEGRSWKVHAVACAVNLGSGLITWLGYKRTFMDGVENFALNTVITEAQIWTQPARAAHEYERLSRERQQDALSVLPAEPRSEWTVNIYPGGFSIKLAF